MKPLQLSDLPVQGTMLEALHMQYVDVSKERVVMTMPIDACTRQPAGLLHGGASVALAETAASVGTWMNIDADRQAAVGVEISASHLRSARMGLVTATATVLHKGRSKMVWDIRITDERERLLCTSRCTVSILDAHAPRETP